MQLTQMQYFLEIAKTGNISAAASNLYLSQPALSQAIRNLEAELGIPLLIRHSKSISLTDAGEQFAIHAEKILGSANQLSDLMRKYSQLLAGNLRLGIPWIAGYMDIFSLLRNYKEIAPDIQYKLMIKSTDYLVKQLLSRKLHGIFIISSSTSLPENKELHHLKLADEEYVALVPESDPLASKDIIRIPELADKTLIMPDSESIFSLQLKVLFQTYNIDPPCLCESSLSAIVAQMVEEGLGIAFASICVAKKICPPNCRIVSLEDAIHRTVYFVTLKELMDYPLVKSFTEYVEYYEFSDPQFNPPGERRLM